MTCIFFGHSDCYELDSQIIQNSIEELILIGVDTFYVGHQGHFDSIVLNCLLQLKKKHQHISFAVVLAYHPTQNQKYHSYHGYSIYPEGLEIGPPRFAIDRRNRWMVERASYCLCYINHSWGGAYKFAKLAKKKGLTVINLGNTDL